MELPLEIYSIFIFGYSSTSYGTPNIYKCFRFPVLLNTTVLNTTDILLGILFDYTTLHRVTIIMPPPVGGGALSGDRRLSSVCLSDVAYIGSNSKTKRPRKTKLCTGYPRSHASSHTDFKAKRSKVKVTGRGILWRPHSHTACFSEAVDRLRCCSNKCRVLLFVFVGGMNDGVDLPVLLEEADRSAV